MQTLRLKQLREERNITQQELADQLSCSQQSIHNYENHGTQPDIDMLCRMADFFNTSVDYLIGNTNVRDPYNLAKYEDSSEKEIRLVNSFRSLPEETKEHFLALMESYSEKQ
ncbi:MAG: helix-turn-helix transcriptional regulator [Oscillospiraceae bacterium]|nr:helix-turn-helix transcriptional regulator [Oscillospiraceae bacterium]